MNIRTAMAWLVVGLINEHFPHPDEPEQDWDPVMGNSGCIINCGPCGALHALSQTPKGRSEIEAAVRLTGFQRGGWSYWDAQANGLRWDWFAQFWAGHKGCASSNGIVEPCVEEAEV